MKYISLFLLLITTIAGSRGQDDSLAGSFLSGKNVQFILMFDINKTNQILYKKFFLTS